MTEEGKTIRPIWASWRVREDGSLQVTSTYARGGDYVREEMEFNSLKAATAALGPGFGDVVARVTAQGSFSGRWRP